MARLDVFERIRFVSSAEVAGRQRAASRPSCSTRTIVVVDETGRRTTRADAVAQILRALPLGVALVLAAAGARPARARELGLRPLRAAADDRLVLARASPPAACRAPGARRSAAPPPPPRPPVVVWLARGVAILREGVVLAMFITIVSETLFINQAVPKFLKFDEAGLGQAAGRLPALHPGLVDVRLRRADDRRIGGRRGDHRRRPARRPLQRGRRPHTRTRASTRSPPPRQRFVLLQLLGAHPRSGRLPSGASRVDPALPRAHRPSAAIASSGSTPTRSRTTAPRRAKPRPATSANTSFCLPGPSRR